MMPAKAAVAAAIPSPVPTIHLIKSTFISARSLRRRTARTPGGLVGRPAEPQATMGELLRTQLIECHVVCLSELCTQLIECHVVRLRHRLPSF